MTYLERKLAEIRHLTTGRCPSDAELVSFIQELVGVGYGDGIEAASVIDGLPFFTVYEVWCDDQPAPYFGQYIYDTAEEAAINAHKFLVSNGWVSPGSVILANNALDRKLIFSADGNWIEIRKVEE